MKKQKIVLVEDEEDIADLIRIQAEMNGYQIIIEKDGLKGFQTIEQERPDIVLLDIMLPGQSGLDICRKVKLHPELQGTPIIMVSAKAEELDELLGLELGADDYITKPFSPKVLFTRIKAVLRRGTEPEVKVKMIEFGDFTMELERYQVKRRDQVIPLTLSEFGILKKLLVNRGKALSRSQLLDDLLNDEAFVIDRNIDVHVAAIRKKLGPNFKYIQTVRGIGYRFLEED
ncbi:MAG: response regulator transcription factor [Chlamydiia bacterium]|nr:response regulator transcription factor [Chlamydiia bacterium]